MHMLIPDNFYPLTLTIGQYGELLIKWKLWCARNIVLTKAQGPLARSLHLIELFPSDVATDRLLPLDLTTDSGAVPHRLLEPTYRS